MTEVKTFQPPLIPRDSDGFVKSFELSSVDCPESNDARAFFDEYGFIVIANVFTQEQCTNTISDIWNVIESLVGRQLRDNDKLWTSSVWGATDYTSEGIIGGASLWTRQILLNRQTQALHTAYATILGTENLLVNHDRYGMFRPTKQYPDRSTITNLHLDMNPWLYIGEQDNSLQIKVLSELKYDYDHDWITENNETGCDKIGELHVQGLVNLADNIEEDGGFWLVPGFHKYLPQWTKEHRDLVNVYGHYNHFVMMNRNHVPELYDAACHISTRAGSAILWNQRTIHGSRANASLRPRYAQFFKMFPVDHPAMISKRAEKRSKAILKKLQAVNINPETDLTSLGRKLFGLTTIQN